MTKVIHKLAEDSARGGIFLVFGALLTIIGYAVASIIVARLLGPEVYGLYTLSLIVTQTLFLLSDLGINQGLTKFCAEFSDQGKTVNVKKIVKYALILKILVTLVLFAINLIFAEFFAVNILSRPELTIHIQLASLSLLFEVIYVTISSIFIGIERTEYSTLASGIQSGSRAIISIILVLAGFSIAGAVLGYVGGFAVGALITSSILFQLMNKIPKTDTDLNFSKTSNILIKFGLPIYFSVIFVGLVPMYQNFLLAGFSTNFEIGNFKASYNFITLISMITIQITNALMPAFSKLNINMTDEIQTFYKFANKYSTLVVVPLAIFFIAFSNEIIQIMYGTEFQSASLFLSLNSSLYLLVGLGFLTLSSLFNGLGKTNLTFKTSLVGFLFLIILSPLLINYYQIPGLIFALLLSNLISTSYAYILANKEYGIKKPNRQLIYIYIASAVSTIPSLLISNLKLTILGFNIIILLELLLFIISYSTFLPAMHIIDDSEIIKARRVVERLKPLEILLKPLFKYQIFIAKKFSKTINN